MPSASLFIIISVPTPYPFIYIWYRVLSLALPSAMLTLFYLEPLSQPGQLSFASSRVAESSTSLIWLW